MIYHEEGRYATAEPLYQKAIAIEEKVRGPEHPDVSACVSNLASLYEEQGQYDRAELLYQGILLIDEKALGRGHPAVGRGFEPAGKALC